MLERGCENPMNNDKKVVPALKFLVLVRNGEFHEVENFLTSRGTRKVEAVGREFARRFGQRRIAMLCSTTQPARQTAEILSKKLGDLPFEQHPCFHSEYGHIYPSQLEDAVRKVDACGVDHEVVILSTHREFVEQFPALWGRTHDLRLPKAVNFPHGSARIVDVLNGWVTKLIPIV